MDDRDSDQLQFRGQDATECRQFIAALLKLAFAQGKQRDDQWIADFAATRMADDALVWWSALDEEIQGSWKLLRNAMLSKYRSMFYGESGEETEKFIRTVCDKAIDEGRQKDNEWIVTYAASCFAGEALRWYALLDSGTQENWKKLQQALLIQYPRGASPGAPLHFIPTSPAAATPASAPKAARRGRIRVSNDNCSTSHYLSKHLNPNNRITSTPYLKDALELEWFTGADSLSTLSIPGSQIPGYNLLGVKWCYDNSPKDPKNFLAFCAVDLQTRSTSLRACDGDLLINNWKISGKDEQSDGILTVSVMTGKEPLYPGWKPETKFVWFYNFKPGPTHPNRADFFFDLI